MDGPARSPARPADGADTAMAWFDAMFARNALSICLGEGDVLVDANDAFLSLIGWTREDFRAAPPAWPAVAQHFGTEADRAAKADALATGTWALTETALRHRDGHWVPVVLGGTVYDTARFRWVGYAFDISRQRDAEQALARSTERLVLGATRDGLFEMERGADALWVSARAAEILEVADMPKGGIVPMTRATLGQSEDAIARHEAAARRAADTGEAYDLEIARTRLDGTQQWIRVRGVPDRSADGVVRRFVGSLSDVTADVAARDALFSSEASVRQAQKMDALGRLASGIAHDFNNMLAVILGYVEVGLAAKPVGPAERALREIGVAGQRSRDLVRRILAFARRTEARSGAGAASVALGDAIRETARMLEATLPPAVRLELEIAPDLPEVSGDAGGVQQVLVNLAMNAEHAMRVRGGTLTLGAAMATPDDMARHTALRPGTYVRAWVRDTGVGIPAELLDRVVEPFFTTKAQGEGTGLGLSVVHGLVEGWGGALRLSSAMHSGTTVDVLLPVANPAPATNAASDTARSAADAEGISPERQEVAIVGRVLVVDDDAAVAEVMAQRLSLLGVTPVVAHSAEAAVRVLTTPGNEIGLVLADLAMPHQDGEWLAQEIRRFRLEVPMAIVTGDRRHLTDERVRALGVVLVLDKPVSGDALRTLVMATFGEPR
jgi:signal transduction histidine kinase